MSTLEGDRALYLMTWENHHALVAHSRAVERTRISSREALDMAFRVLTPAQRVEPARLIASDRFVPTHR